MPPRSSPPPVPETGELILEAAGRIFAQHGFRATTVRQITRAAGVNLAAVNYHFHDKQELYARALQRAHQAAARTAAADRPGQPQQRLGAFIHGFLGYLFDPQRPEWQGRLIAREIAEPSPALDRLVAESIVPVKERLSAIVRELLGPGATEMHIRRVAFSVLGQCLYYVHCREMIKRLFPAEPPETDDVDALAEHVFQFSLAGAKALRRQSQAPATNRFLRAPRARATHARVASPGQLKKAPLPGRQLPPRRKASAQGPARATAGRRTTATTEGKHPPLGTAAATPEAQRLPKAHS